MSSEPSVRVKAQQAISIFALIMLAAFSWYFLVETENAMRVMRGDGLFVELMWMMMEPNESIPYLAATTAMWIVMMFAMMVPAVMPMVIVFCQLDRGPSTELDAVLFAGGYLLAWCMFSVVAATLQWSLHGVGQLHGDLLSVRPLLAASILILAGAYQLTPMKEACLNRCRSPIGFFLANWRSGRLGAIRMGLQHGLFCIGCCWMLMLLMFVGGAMSVVTMALLSIFILAERVLPSGPWVSWMPGVVLIAWGGYIAIFA